jgi:hypothetical protein
LETNPSFDHEEENKHGISEGQNSLHFSSFEESVSFILSHFQSPFDAFPRKMMAFKSNAQFTVVSKEEILKRCRQSDYKDCRINAYPEIIEKDGMLIQPPNFILIDLDLADFDGDFKQLDKVKNSTLRKMAVMSGFPTVSWTGNGYHICLPIKISVLDHQYIFSKDRFPRLFSKNGKYSEYWVSEVFMQFAGVYFTNKKSGTQHGAKYKTCLTRIPETYNSKCLLKGRSECESKVKLLQKWDGKRIDAEPLIHDFGTWLIKQGLDLKNINIKKHGL